MHPAPATGPAAEALEPTWRMAVTAYLAEKYGRSGSDRTTSEYGRLLARFFAAAQCSPDHVSPMHVHAFAYRCGPSGQPPSPSTIGVRLAAVGGFFDFAVRMRLLSTNPASEVRRPRPARRVVRSTGAAEFRSLLAAVPSTALGERDRALILTAVMTGLRRAELASLLADDFRAAIGALHVRTKGGHERLIAIPPPAAQAIAHWRDIRQNGSGRDPRLFGLTGAGIYARIRRYARSAGLAGQVTPHRLRHAAAQLWRADGASIEEIGALLGHASIATTARYLTRSVVPTGPHWKAVADAIGIPHTPATAPANQTEGRKNDESPTPWRWQPMGIGHPPRLPARRSELGPPEIDPPRMDREGDVLGGRAQ